MPVIANTVTLGTGTTNNNVVSGSAFEFARVQSIVSIGIVASITGGFCTIQSGSDIVAEEFPIPIVGVAANNPGGVALTTTSQFPIIPDQMYFTDVMQPGDRLVMRVRNTNAGSLTVAFIVQLSPTGA